MTTHRDGRALPRRLKAVLLVSTALIVVSALPAVGAPPSQDGTWLANPGSGDYNAGTNWDTGTTPFGAGIAYFGASSVTSLTMSAPISAGGWIFSPGAPAYQFQTNAELAFFETGITTNGGSVTIDNSSAGTIHFYGITTASDATFINAGSVVFNTSATAGNATITNTGTVAFRDQSSGGNARLINNGPGAVIDFSDTFGPLYGNKVTAGSITGNGTFKLGANELTVGGNNLSTTVSGVIEGTGSLVKTGTGTLTLSGANTYSGGTTIAGGVLSVSSDANLGGTSGGLTLNGGTLQVTGTSSFFTNRDVTLGANGGTFDIVANQYASINRVITGSGGLTKSGAGDMSAIIGSSYTGVVTILGGSLDLADGAAAPVRVNRTIVNHGTLYMRTSPGLDYSGVISGTGTLHMFAGELILSGANTYTGATSIASYSKLKISGSITSQTITNEGALDYIGASSAGTATIDVRRTNNGVDGLHFRDTSTAGNATVVNGGQLAFFDRSTAGNATIANNGVAVFIDNSSAGNATIVNNGTVYLSSNGAAGNATITNNYYMTLDMTASAGSAHITNNSAGTILFKESTTAGSASIANAGKVLFTNNSTGGNAQLINDATSAIVDFSDSTGLNGDRKVEAGSLAGTGLFRLGNNELTVGGNNLLTMVTGTIADGGAGGGSGAALVKTGTGTLTLAGLNTYTGATTINGGTLAVNSTLTATSGITVNGGGTLGGTGTVGHTTINAGGTLAPGNSIGTLIVSGNLSFNSGGIYAVEVSPTTADRTNVTGTALLTGATVNAIAIPGSFRERTYTILNAAGGLGGTLFAGLTATGNFSPARNPHLIYDANNVYLMLYPETLAAPPNANGGQAAVIGAINRVVDAGGSPPVAFDALLAMNGGQLGNALTQMSGQPATGGATSGMQMTNAFLSLMLNPFGGAPEGNAGALGFARGFGASDTALSPDIAAAYAAVTPKDARAETFDRRWNLWGQPFGGYHRTGGDSMLGTADTSARAAGFAAGADCRVAPDTLLGFALAGGATSWGLAQNLGGGRSDVFQIGAYGSQSFGNAYVSAGLSYAWHGMSTERLVTVVGTDRLAANFNGHSFGGRIESGYRFATPWLGVTPYAALQVQSFHTPSYGENAMTGSGVFALRYDARTATATRSELGAWFEKRIALDGGSALALRSRAAWAYDHTDNTALGAIFQILPGSNFTVNGAAPAPNAALFSASAEWRLINGWSVGARFDGELTRNSTTYAGNGLVRYAW